MGAHFEALDEGNLLMPLEPRYTQVGFNLLSVQVCFQSNIVFNSFMNQFKTIQNRPIIPFLGKLEWVNSNFLAL